MRKSLFAALCVSCCCVALVPVDSNGASGPNLPTNGAFTSGAGSIAVTPGQITITQSTPRGIIAFDSFSVGTGNTVAINDGAGATLARVGGGSTSDIAGKVVATGSFYLVNPNGIVIDSGGSVLTGGSFVASTLTVPDSAFMAGGSLAFSGTGSGAIVNFGHIASANGDILLIAGSVTNGGGLDAPKGDAVLAAGSNVVLTESGDLRASVRGLGGDVTNTGAIQAINAELVAASGNIYALAGNDGGIIRATDVAERGGRIYLAAPNGKIVNAGTLDASGKGASSAGGEIDLVAKDINLQNGGLADASGTGRAAGGRVLVGGDVHGGADPAQDLGTVPLATAQSVEIDQGATLKANGGAAGGKGGDVVAWGDQGLWFAGAISAVGGPNAAGGFVETSSHGDLEISGSVQTGVKASTTPLTGGQWLIDPYDVTIAAALPGGYSTSGANPVTYSANATGSTILASTIISSLAGGSNVLITTGASGAEAGNITVNAAINPALSSAETLTLQAAGSISVNAPISATGAALGIVLDSNAAGGNLGGIAINAAGSLASNGGNIIIGGGAAPATNAADGSGTANANGVTILGAIAAAGGNIVINGTGNATGIQVQAAVTTTGSGTIAATGVGGTGGGNGVFVVGGSIQSVNGSITLAGTGGNGSWVNTSSAQGVGVGTSSSISGQIISTTGSGSIVITGTGGPTEAQPVALHGSPTITTGSGGTITLTGIMGASPPASIDSGFAATASIYADGILGSANTGAITLTGDSINVISTIRSATLVTLQSYTAGLPVLFNGPSGIAWSPSQLVLLAGDISVITAPVLRIGMASEGSITVSQSTTLAAGAVPTLDLITGSTISAAAGAALRVTNLAIQASGTVTLDSTANTVTTLAASTNGAALNFLDSGTLTVGVVDGVTGLANLGGASTVATAAGNLTVNNAIAGSSASSITLQSAGAIAVNAAVTASGTATALVLDSNAGGGTTGGITVASTGSLASNGGNITIGGGASPATGAADSSGTSGANGFYNKGGVNAGGGNITINATGYASGIDVAAAIQTNGSGTITANGTGVQGNGIYLQGAVTAVNGAINLTGIGGSVFSHEASGYGILGVSGGGIGTSGSGSVTAFGAAGPGTPQGIAMHFSDSIAVGSGGQISLSGTIGSSPAYTALNSFNSAAAVYSDGTIGGTTAGAVTITGDSITLLGTVKSGVSVTLEPLTAGLPVLFDASGSLTWSPSQLVLFTNDISAVAAPILRAGSTSAGALTVSQTTTLAAGTVATLDLESGAGISNAAGAALTVTNLALQAGGAVILSSPANTVTTLAAQTNGGALNYLNSGSLTVGTVDGVSGLTNLGGTSSVVTNSGNLTVNSPITASGALTLTAAGNATISTTIDGAVALAINTGAAGNLTVNDNLGGISTLSSLITSSNSLVINSATAPTIAATGGITLDANTMTWSGTAITSSSFVTLAPLSAGQAINLGATGTVAGTLTLSQAEIGTVSAPILQIGRNDAGFASGALTLSQAITAASSVSTLSLVTGGAISETGTGMIQGTNLALAVQAGGSADLSTNNSIVSSFAAVTGGAVKLSDTPTAGGILTIGTVADVNSATQTVSSISGVSAGAGSSLIQTNGALAVTQSLSTTDTSTTALAVIAGDGVAAGTASGGDITVSNGATVTVGAGGQANLYTGSIAGSSGLSTVVPSGDFRYDSNHTTTNFTTALTAGVNAIYREQPTLTASIYTGGTGSKVYDGATLVPSFIIAGADNGDAGTTGGTISGGTLRNAGSYTLTSSNVTTTLTGLGYALVQPSSASYTITPEILTITALGVTKTYDGTIAAPGTATIGGTIYDPVTTAATMSFDTRNAGSGKTVTASGLVINDGNGGNNYTIDYVANAAGTVNPEAITVTAVGATKTYDGTISATGTPIISGTLYDSVTTAATDSFANRNAGTGKTVDASGLVINDGNAGNNYAVTYVASTSGTINPEALTVTALGVTKTYDGTTAAPGTATVAGTLYDTVTTAASMFFSNRNAGTDKTVTASGMVINDGNGGNNYTINYVANTAGVINPETLSVTALGVTKTYDGTTAAPGTATIGGTIYDPVTTAATMDFANRNAGTGKTVTASGLVINDGNGGNNYTINYVASASGTINPEAITVTAVGATKTYDGTTVADGTPTVAGTIYDTVTTNASLFFANRNAGTDKTVLAGGLVINDGNGGQNYSVNYVASTSGTINPAQLTVTAAAVTKTYDGTTAVTGNATVTGTLYGADTVATQASLFFANRNAGTGKTVLASGMVVNDGNGGENYTIDYVANTNGTINPEILTVSATAAQKTYDGTTSAPGTPTVSGTIYTPDSVATAASQAFATDSAGTAKQVNAGGLAINDGDGGGNYDIIYVANAGGTISPKPLIVTAVSAMRSVNQANPNFVLANYLNQVVNGDQVTVSGVTLLSPAGPLSPAGRYDILASGGELSGAESGDYTLVTATNIGGLTVTPLGNVIGGPLTNQVALPLYDPTVQVASSDIWIKSQPSDEREQKVREFYRDEEAETAVRTTALGIDVPIWSRATSFDDLVDHKADKTP